MSSDTFSFVEFEAKVVEIARRTSPLLVVSQAEWDTCLIKFPGLSNQVWVKAAQDGTKFRVSKANNKNPIPAQLAQIAATGEGFLAEVLRNYIAEVGRPQ